MGFGLTPYTLDGMLLMTGTYADAFFNAGDDPLSTVTHEAIEAEIAGNYPVVNRQQPEGKVFPLHIVLDEPTEANMAAVKCLCDPDKGAIILTAKDQTPVTRRLTVYVEDLKVVVEEDEPQYIEHVAILYAPRPVWESDAEHTTMITGSASPTTWQVTNAGTKRVYPVFEIKPTAAKAHTVDYLYRWPISIASRTPLDMVDTLGGPYPIDVADGNLNTLVEIAAGRMQADGDDLRVLLNGVETRRDLSGMSGTDTKVWSSIPFKGMLRATLAADMTAIAPANGGSIAVSNANGLVGWPLKGFVLWANGEKTYYGDRTDTELLEILRGSGGTTAAIHTAGDYMYRSQHDVQVLSDYTAATEPNGADVDRKPVIDLAASTNLKHVYPGPLTAPGTLRPGQWLRKYTNDNLLSPAISLLDDGTIVAFRDIIPSADAPQFNNLELYTPCGVKAAAGAIAQTISMTDFGTLSYMDKLTLELLGMDMEGFESLLQRYQSYGWAPITPAAVLSRIRYNANLSVITGASIASPSDKEVTTSPMGQQFTLDKSTLLCHLILRLKRTPWMLDWIQVWLAEDDLDNIGERISPILYIAPVELGAAYWDKVAWLNNPIAALQAIRLPAGKYWLVVCRDGNSGEHVYAAYSPTQVYARGLFSEVVGGGLSGPRSGGTFADDASVGTIAWNNPNDVATSNDLWAETNFLAVGEVSHYLKATNFGFTIPTGALILGIQVDWERHYHAAGEHAKDFSVRIVKGGTIQGHEKASTDDWPWADTYKSYGSQTDLWGLAWTAADINAATFGAVLSIGAIDAGTPQVDHVRISVWYGQAAYQYRQTLDFAVVGSPAEPIQEDAPCGSGQYITLDNVAVTFDNATPLTPLIVRGAQETIYHLNAILKNDDTGQEVSVVCPIALNDILRIDTYNKRIQLIPVSANDPTVDVPWAAVFSDEADWLYLIPGVNNLRATETGMGTVEYKTIRRDAWA